MPRVLLAVNCQLDSSYQNREVLQSLYGDRFDAIAFVVNHSCATDKHYTNIISYWEPAPLGADNRCLCGNPFYGDHSIGVHTFHPRLQYVADNAEDYEFVLFVEDDCVLSPRVTANRVQELCANYDAVLPGIWLCNPTDSSWVWNRRVERYSNREGVKKYFDAARLREHWRNFSGAPFPPQPGVPMFAGFADFFILRVSLLRQIIADLQALEQVWHEIAIPTAILHHTSRIGLAEGIALWGDDRNRPLNELIAMLRSVDWLHPVKLSMYPSSRIRDAYRAIALTDHPR